MVIVTAVPRPTAPPPGPHTAPAGVQVNMADVAARAGVSTATVSRALRGLPGVGAPTRARIEAIATELSYVVSPEASALSRRETGRIAVVVARLDVWFYSSMLAAIQRTLHAAGVDVLLYLVEDERQRRDFFEDLPSRRKVDGVVLIALPLAPAEIERLDLLGVDVVVAGGRLRELPRVEVDDRAIGALATHHLLDLGHRRIGMVRTSDTDGSAWSADRRRLAGFRDALRLRGLDPDPSYVVAEPFSGRAGARGLSRLLDLPEPPTAVFAYSDELAVGVLAEAHARGLAVPGDLSVMGVDGHPLGETFGLTTVDQRVEAQGSAAARLTLARLAGDAVEPPQIGVELVVRRTTGPPADLTPGGGAPTQPFSSVVGPAAGVALGPAGPSSGPPDSLSGEPATAWSG